MTKYENWIIEKDFHRKGRRTIFSGWVATLVGKNNERLEIVKSYTKKSLFAEIDKLQEVQNV